LRLTIAKISSSIFLPLAVWAGTSNIASAQQQDPARVRVHSELVTLAVTVTNRAGNLVGDLTPEQFRLLDDGVEQAITVFAEEKVPLSLVILIDNDLNGKEGARMVQSLRALLSGVSLEDQAMVCRFDMLFYPGEGFTSDLDKLMIAVKQAQQEIKPTPKFVPEPVVCGNSTTGPPCIPAPAYAGGRPSKALDDALFSAAELLEGAGDSPRKIILLISDGANEPKLNKHDYETVKAKLLSENISVFSLATGSDTDKRKFQRMENYSRASGGDIFLHQKAEAWSRTIHGSPNRPATNTRWPMYPPEIIGVQIIIGWNFKFKATGLACRPARAITTISRRSRRNEAAKGATDLRIGSGTRLAWQSSLRSGRFWLFDQRFLPHHHHNPGIGDMEAPLVRF
jgi:VWFA-related protein